jgi:hypothetical protein
MKTRPKLTDAVEAKILTWIRSGVYAHVAAEAEGIPWEVFEQWLGWGTRRSPRPIRRYARFAANVREAAAFGRLRAEMKIFEKDAKLWLLSGPGKERQDYPGWSSAAKAIPRRAKGEPDLFADPALAALLEAMLNALEPFPDARRAAVAALYRPRPEQGRVPTPPDGEEAGE